MPDSTYFIITNTDSLQKVADSLASIKWMEEKAAAQKEKDEQNVLETGIFLFVAMAVLVIGILKVASSKEKGWYILRVRKPWDSRYYDDRREDEKYYDVYVPAEPEPVTKSNYLVYEGSNLGFSRQQVIDMLLKHYPYYCYLNPIQKKKFVNRLHEFMGNKTFIIHASEGYKEMPVLLSAAAIQLTFGLDSYMLPYYQYINIHPEEYFAENSFRVLAGNVQGNAITIAWNHFLKGIKHPTDGVNVGLHEMAHAVYYQHVIVDNKREKDFCNCFSEVMEEGAEVYDLKTTKQVLFTNNAFKDLQEFWAESVELFFERPFDLKNHFPELFDAVSELLKQNPCNASDPVIGG